jgi:DNA-binding transcriptional LysR family regulator
MRSLTGIVSFVAVASHGSFTAAAKALGVSAVAVSKSVATLERQLGVRLFQRTTRKLNLTSEGQIFFGQCERPLRELQSAQAAVEHSAKAVSGVIKVTCLSPIAIGFLVPLMQQFHVAYPKVHVELHLDDSVSDMVVQSFDIGIRVGQMQDNSFIARPIAPLPFVVCASPAYLAARGVPVQLDELQLHNCIRLRWPGRAEPVPWFVKGGAAIESMLRGNFSVTDFYALLAAAAQGQGLACLPLPLAMPLFRAGQLKPVLTHAVDAQYMMYLHYPSRKSLPARTRAFVEFVLEYLKREPDLQTHHIQLLAPFVGSRDELQE